MDYGAIPMLKASLLALSVAIMVLGLAIYASGYRKRKFLDVPLLSEHSKFFLGGILAFFGLVLLVVALMHAG